MGEKMEGRGVVEGKRRNCRGVEAGHNVEDRISVSFNLTPQIENETAYFGEVAKHYAM